MNRLMSDVMGNPMMMAEAMTIKDQAAMETFIEKKGYDLTKQELGEVWAMASKFMSGQGKGLS